MNAPVYVDLATGGWTTTATTTLGEAVITVGKVTSVGDMTEIRLVEPTTEIVA